MQMQRLKLYISLVSFVGILAQHFIRYVSVSVNLSSVAFLDFFEI